MFSLFVAYLSCVTVFAHVSCCCCHSCSCLCRLTRSDCCSFCFTNTLTSNTECAATTANTNELLLALLVAIELLLLELLFVSFLTGLSCKLRNQVKEQPSLHYCPEATQHEFRKHRIRISVWLSHHKTLCSISVAPSNASAYIANELAVRMKRFPHKSNRDYLPIADSMNDPVNH
jgi:hypothetical protein